MTKELAKTLIDKAAETLGTRKAVADALGVPATTITMWASGARKCQPDDIAAIAEIAGYNAMEFLARATVEETEGTPKGLVLKAALGKYLGAIGAAVATSSAGASTLDGVAHLIRCILC